MSKGWMYLLLAGLSEIVWAFGLKKANGFTMPEWSIFTIIIIFVSFYLFSKAIKTIAMGTAYAVFTGIGAAGTTLVGIVFLEEGTSLLKLLSLAVIVLGIVGLKVSDKKVRPQS